MTEGPAKREPPADVHALLERIDESWRRFLAAVDGIPDDRHEEPGASGDWSLKDLFGHIAFWDGHAADEIARALAGQPREETEWQETNEAVHADRRHRTLPEQRTAMHQAHAHLVERLQDVAGIDAARLDPAIRPDTYEHYEDHLPDIEQWRQRSGL